MPIGIIINSLAIILGGVFGSAFGHKLPLRLKTELNLIFGLCSMGMGISSIVLMQNMPAIILAIIIGTSIGMCCQFGVYIQKAAALMQKPVAVLSHNQDTASDQAEYLSTVVTLIVLFCASGTGIYGSLDAGMTGDSTILVAKSILDFFTAAIFACNLGYIVSVIAVPQFIIFSLLVLCAKLIFPLTTPEMINDFKACGGFLLVATSFRILKLIDFPVADMIPCMVLVMPVSSLWSSVIMPLL